MKCVIAISCLLAVASAGYLGNAAVGGVHGGALGYANHGSHAVAYNAPLVSAPHPVHVGYAGPLAHAYAAHTGPIDHGHHGSHAVAYNAPLVSAPHPVHVAYAGPLAHAYAANTGPVAHGYAHRYAHAAPLATQARLVDPIAIAAGAPLPTGDTVEVAAAKAAHYQAHAVAKSLAHSAPIAHGYAHAAPIAHGYAHAAPLATQVRLVDPIAIAAGAPLPTGDTVEVAAAKAAHFHAHHAAKAGHYLVKRSPGYLHSAIVAAPLAYAAPAHSYSYSSQITHAAPVHSYGYSSYASPLAYSGYSGHGYGGHHGAYHG